jgi:hypothetical protein
VKPRIAGLGRPSAAAFSPYGGAKTAFSLADNKIALNADWEMDQLKVLWRAGRSGINFDLK